MKTYRAVVIGCSRMGGFIDNEIVGDPAVKRPFSHAAVFTTLDRTELVGCADLRTDVMNEFGKMYNVPTDHQYTDYRQLIDAENPDIVSIATQPEQRAAIVVYAAEHGVKAIYAEKAMASSMEEADMIVDAVERNGVAFNLGTNRRWDPGFDTMKNVIDNGDLGDLRSLIIYESSDLFNMGSHNFDTIMHLNNDNPVSWVQAHLPYGYHHEYTDGTDFIGFDGDILISDPAGHGIIQFENGVTAYALITGQSSEYQVICDKGSVTSLANGLEWSIIKRVSNPNPNGSPLKHIPFPEYAHGSPTLKLVEDLVHSLDTGSPTRGGVKVAHKNLELIFAFIQSHLSGGTRVNLPLKNCKLTLNRSIAPKQPMYKPR